MYATLHPAKQHTYRIECMRCGYVGPWFTTRVRWDPWHEKARHLYAHGRPAGRAQDVPQWKDVPCLAYERYWVARLWPDHRYHTPGMTEE